MRSAIKLMVLWLLALGTVSCGASIQSRGTDPSRSAEEAGVEDSGRHLTGEYELASQEDAYRRDSQGRIAFTFDENGNFKRQDISRTEEGSYLISTNRELVLYVEKVNGEQRAAARVDHFEITDERDDGFTLRGGSIGRAAFRKR